MTAWSAMLFGLSLTAFAQGPGPGEAPFLGYPDSFQINVVQNLQTADSIINLTQGGAHATVAAPKSGYMCANLYVFSGYFDADPQGEQMQACCSCPISRNGSANIRARDLIRNPAFNNPIALTGATVKIVWTTPTNGGGPYSSGGAICNPVTLPTAGVAGVLPAAIVPGSYATSGRAWATHWHARTSPTDPLPAAFGTETRFESVALSQAERNVLSTACGFIVDFASGAGICPGCAGVSNRGPQTPTGSSL